MVSDSSTAVILAASTPVRDTTRLDFISGKKHELHFHTGHNSTVRRVSRAVWQILDMSRTILEEVSYFFCIYHSTYYSGDKNDSGVNTVSFC